MTAEEEGRGVPESLKVCFLLSFILLFPLSSYVLLLPLASSLVIVIVIVIVIVVSSSFIRPRNNVVSDVDCVLLSFPCVGNGDADTLRSIIELSPDCGYSVSVEWYVFHNDL